MSAIGLLGGTFDPVHRGHLELAERSSRKCGLDKVILIPAASPPHKDVHELTPFHQRVEMLRIAISDRYHFAISEVEATIRPPSYTIDMLNALLPENPKDDFYFIIGSDAFLEVKTWKSYSELLHRLHLIVVPRKGFDGETLAKHFVSLGYRDTGDYWQNTQFDKKLYCLERPPVDVSSTEIREMACGSPEMRGVVPKGVCEYIVSKRLYSCSG